VSPRALACPASLKGCVSAPVAGEALAVGFRRAGISPDVMPVADGGEGTADVLCSRFEAIQVVDAFGRPRVARTGLTADGTRVVEAAEAIPLDPVLLDVRRASSRGFGLLLREVGSPRRLVVGLGGTANMDAGAGLLDVLASLPAPTVVACDVDARLLEAPRLFGPQKGATPEDVAALEERFAATGLPDVPGGGAAGGLGAALASLGAELRPGATLVLDEIGFDPRPYDFVVTGEGTVEGTTARGKAPWEVARRCADAGVRGVVFGGRVDEPLPGVETVALSGDPARAADDLVELGRRLGSRLDRV
jgi:glycerate 2-kinase